MICIYKKTYSEEEFSAIIFAAKAKVDCTRKLGFNYYSRELWKQIQLNIDKLSLSIDHFDSSMYSKERRGIIKVLSKEILEKAIADNLTLKQLGELFGCSKSNIRHYIRKFGLKLSRGAREKFPKDLLSVRLCRVCGETDVNKFYGNKASICGRCHNQIILDNGRKKKKFARDLLGGKCAHCGYKLYQVALDIHHLSPQHKDINFKSMRGWSLDRIKEEMKHCILLCRNCHAAVHSGEIALTT